MCYLLKGRPGSDQQTQALTSGVLDSVDIDSIESIQVPRRDKVEIELCLKDS